MIFLTIANVQPIVDLLREALWEASSAFIVVDVLFFLTVFGWLILEKE